MIDFKNFKIKRGPSKDLHDPRLIVEEGYWYLSTDKAELFIGIVENGTPVLKPINGELIPEVNLEGYATEDFVREAIKNIDIPEVELYDDTELRNLINSKADKEHTHEEYSLIDHKHDEYLTAHQDISHLATKEEIPNLDGYAKLENIPDVSKFITEIPAVYVTETELENKGYLTEHQSLAGYATESYVLAEIAKAALEGNDIDLSAYATKEFVAEEINKIEIPEAYDDAELRTLISGKAESDHTHEEYSLVDHKHAEYLTEHQDLSHLALKEHEHEQYLTEHQSLEGYAKTTDLFSKDYNDLTNKPEIPSIEGLASETYVQTEIGKIKFPETDLSNYYTKEEVDALLPVEEIEEVKTKVEAVLLPKVEEEIEPTVAELKAWVDANNEIQDVILAKVGEDLNILENNIGYVKVDDRSFAEVIDETFAKKVEIPSIEGLATEEFVNKKILEAELADKEADLEAYYTKSEVDALIPDVPTKVSELENDTKYITETDLKKEIGICKIHLDSIEHNSKHYAYQDFERYNSISWQKLLIVTYDFVDYIATVSQLSTDYYAAFVTIGRQPIELRISRGTDDGQWVIYVNSMFVRDASITDIENAIANIEHPANPTKVSELENDANYTDETKVLELIENNASSKIGIDFTTNITIGGLHAGTTITKNMTIGQLLYRMLYCEHDFVAVECGKPMICEYCGAEGPLAEHDPIINEGHEATCGSAGRTDEIYCGRCGEILEPAEEIPALEHIPSSSLDYSEEPTCTEVGYIKTRCELCGDVLDVQEVPALGHEFVDGICIRCGEVDPNYNPDQPEVPDSVVEEIISKELPMYSIDYDGNVTSKEFEIVTFNGREEANQAPVESCFYQVKDENGDVIESGYQDMQIVNDEMYYIIALPKSVDYNSDMVRMQAYDDEEQLWVEYTKLPLTSDPEIVASCCDEVGVDISHINQDLYTVWVNEDTCTGSRLRYIIEE